MDCDSDPLKCITPTNVESLNMIEDDMCSCGNRNCFSRNQDTFRCENL